MRLLINLFVYVTGFMIGFLVKNNGILFFLLVIPNIVVYYILDKKQRGFDELIRRYKNGEFDTKNHPIPHAVDVDKASELFQQNNPPNEK